MSYVHLYVVVFIMFIDLRREVSVPFVDIEFGGIVDHHCL